MFKKALPVWSVKYANERNILLSFKTEIDFLGKYANMHIAADAQYTVYINDEFAFHGPQRCGRGRWREDELDLTHSLKRNEHNQVEIRVLSYGVTSFEYIMQHGFLQAEIEIDGVCTAYTAVSGGGFDVRRMLSKEQVVERYSYQRPFIEVWHLPQKYSEPLELEQVADIVLLPRTAPYPEYKTVYPTRVMCKGTAEADEENSKCGDSDRMDSTDEPDFSYAPTELRCLFRKVLKGLTITSKEMVDAPADNAPFRLDEKEWITFKFDHNDTGFVKCTMKADTDSEVYFMFDEIAVDGDADNAKHWVGVTNMIPVYMEKGTEYFIATEPRTMQYLKVMCARGSVEFDGLSLVEYVNPLGRTARFTSDDEALNRVYEAAVNTFEQNAVDVFMDCPSRERAGWLCDSFFTGRVEKDLTGGSAVEKGFLENFFIATEFTRIPKGMLPMCYPSDELSASYIPNWPMFLVIELEEYVQRTGDTAILELAKERLYGLEEYFCQKLNDDGLLEKLTGWVFVEWSQANKWVQDVNFPSNMMYYAMLKAMARMYNDAALDAKAEKIKETIRRLSFNGTFFRDRQIIGADGKKTTPEDITEVCQYYAFFTHVAEKEDYPELLEIISKDFGAGHKCEKTHPGVYPANAFIGNYLRMEVLSQNGYRKQIIGEIKDYFDYMAKLTGTLWENDASHASCNHGFASHVVRFIFRDCLGLDRVDEINKKVYLNNDFNAPENASAVIPLKNGSVKITISGGARKVDITGDYKLG